MARSRIRTSAPIAIAVHAAAIASVWLGARPTPATQRFEAPAEIPLDVDFVTTAAATLGERTTVPAETAPTPRPSGGGAHVGAASVAAPRDSSGDGPPVESSDAGTIQIARAVPVDLGIGGGPGPNPFVPRNEGTVDRAEANRQLREAMREAMRAHDREIGLGPEGPVLTALADATMQSVAPVRGRAVFVVAANADGEVVSFDLEDAEGGRPGWADAGRLAREALGGKKLRVDKAQRTVMRIEVSSAWKLPSGQDPGTDVEMFGIPVAKGEGKQSGKVVLFDPIPHVRVDQIELGPGVKIPIVSVSIPLLNMATNVDPTNIGAHPRRVVHTRVLETSAM